MHLDGLLTAVPSEVRGLFDLHQKFGKLKWSEVMAPVVALAEGGYTVTPALERNLLFLGIERIKSLPNFKYVKFADYINLRVH